MCGHSQREVFPSQSKEILLSLPYLHSRHLTTGTASMVGSASSTGFPSASTSLITRPPCPCERRIVAIVITKNGFRMTLTALVIALMLNPSPMPHLLHLLPADGAEGGEGNLSHLFPPTV